MKTAIVLTRGLVGITGLAQLALGVTFWTGHALSLVTVHMGIGVVFVLSLWTLAILSARAGAPIGLAIFALVWGALLPLVGMLQMQWLPGSAHWLVRTLHLLMGVAAMGLAGALTRRAGMRGPHARQPEREEAPRMA